MAQASDLRYATPTSAELERWLAEHAPDAQARGGATIDVPAGWIPVALSALEELLDARTRVHRPSPVVLRAMRTGTEGHLLVDVVHGNERDRGTVAGARALSAEICAQCGCAGDPVESRDGARSTLCGRCRTDTHRVLARPWAPASTPDHPNRVSPGQWTQDLRGPGTGADWDAEHWRNYGKLETTYGEAIERLMRADDDAQAMRLWAGGPGWAPLVRALFATLRPEQEERPGEPGHTPWRLRWMTEKFGTLRVRTCRCTQYQLGVQFVIELQSHMFIHTNSGQHSAGIRSAQERRIRELRNGATSGNDTNSVLIVGKRQEYGPYPHKSALRKPHDGLRAGNRSAKPWSRPAGCYVRWAQTTDFHALRPVTTSVRSDWHGLTHVYHPSHNLVSHHEVMMDRTGKWHYKCAFEGRLHERLAGPSRSRSDAQGVVDRLLGRFGAGRLAHVQGAPIGTAEGGGNALLAFEDAP